MLKNYYSIYKYGNWLVQHHVPVLPAVLKLVSRIFFPACDIPFTAKIGKSGGGVEIGDNAIVGAGAVVLKDVPAACVACGVPATVVKKLVEEK